MAMYDDELSQKIIKWLQDNYKEKIKTITNKESVDNVTPYLKTEFVKSLKTDDYWTKEDKNILAGEILTADLTIFTPDGHHYFVRRVNAARCNLIV